MKTKPRPSIRYILVMSLAAVSLAIAISCMNYTEVLWKYPVHVGTIVVGIIFMAIFLVLVQNFGR